MNFNEMNLSNPILRALEELNFEKPSVIQEKTIPVLLEGRDVLGCAQTGSGKTAAFSLPILEMLSKEKSKNIRALILTPTRELAVQITQSIESYAKYMSLRVGTVYGGIDQKYQVDMLKKGVDILVATPGRLVDLWDQGLISLGNIEMFVLDEADRMLDMGFLDPIKLIANQLPVKRQTLLFSATMPKEIERFAMSMLTKPVTIKQARVTDTVSTISQSVYYIDEPNKLLLLIQLIKAGDVKNAIVFTNTKRSADKVMKHLHQAAVRALAIHGDKAQRARQDALLQFKNGTIKVLVATDVAARGIDVAKLSHVFNFDIPESPDNYIHRIGRTGRAGESGIAINFCNIDDVDNLKAIERHIRKRMTVVESGWPMKILEKKEKPQGRRGGKSGQAGRSTRTSEWGKTTDAPRRERATRKEKEPIDVTKVKDVTPSGKPVVKKKYTPYKPSSKSEFGKDKTDSRRDKNDGKGEFKKEFRKDSKKEFKKDFKKDFKKEGSYGNKKKSVTGKARY